MKVFDITEQPGEVQIHISGEIGGGWWEEGVSFSDVKAQLEAVADNEKEVRVIINSLGGDVDEAFWIYEILNGIGERVTTEIYGRCASAATIIAMAGRRRKMSRFALFLIHKCWSHATGNDNQLEEVIAEQRAINGRMVAIYAEKTGKRAEEIEELMNRNNGNGEWLNIEEAQAYGFVTEPDDNEYRGAEAEYLTGRIRAMINHKKERNMKKEIKAHVLLSAVLGKSEAEADKEGRVLMSDEMLASIEAALTERDTALAAARSEAEAEREARAEAERQAEAQASQVAELEAQVAELQALVKAAAEMPNDINGKDTTNADSFQAEYMQSEMYREALEKMGR